MSLSKLESLPNEILSDIIEKYINGVDVVVALSYQLNQRFNSLIARCSRLHFDFIQCRKDDFCFCMGLLPAYIDKIEELAISEQNTPGQVHAFFTFYSSFEPFKRLRKLYLHLNGEAVDWKVVEMALLSLSKTTVEALSINASKMPELNGIVAYIFGLKKLKRLSFNSDADSIGRNLSNASSSTIEHLTISGGNCEFQHLKSICRRAPHLKYLNVRITDRLYYTHNDPSKRLENNTELMPALRTLILSFERTASTTFKILAQWLSAMPVLNRLEIKAHGAIFDAEAWEMLLKTSLPLLTYFSLWTTTSRIVAATLYDVLASFQTLFWLGKKNFNIKITKHEPSNTDGKFMSHFLGIQKYDFDLPVIQCWMAPERFINDSSSTLDEITSLNLFLIPVNIRHHYYFNKVKYLTLSILDEHLLVWLTTYVNCSQIRELAVSSLNKEAGIFTSFLSYASNINSLRMSFGHLIVLKKAAVGGNHFLKHLDISVDEHTLNKEDIIVIAELFPSVEHIKINTQSLYNVPILGTHLPHLRSLTFTIKDYTFDDYDYYSEEMLEHQLRRKTQFLFQRENDSIAIWVDQAALEEPYWQTFDKNLSKLAISSVPTTTSNNSEITAASENKKKKKRKFLWPSCFKK